MWKTISASSFLKQKKNINYNVEEDDRLSIKILLPCLIYVNKFHNRSVANKGLNSKGSCIDPHSHCIETCFVLSVLKFCINSQTPLASLLLKEFKHISQYEASTKVKK
ncbi:hypothetical protein ABEB36_005982 [Hypothenemus hampei]|uniref:Uncharacterized protein n=1 Tax=Hypothenemus hampei TaxID=57062 RepID=A0ABD1F031_HYPHA